MRIPIAQVPFEEALPRLMGIDIFRDFSEENEDDVTMFRSLYDKCHAETYDEGDVIISEGENGKELYILTHGVVQIFRKTQFGDEIAIADIDDSFDVFFGEAALVDEDQRSATVRAGCKCTVLALDGNDFVELCKEYPRLGFYVYRRITKRMQQVIKRANRDIATLYSALFREIEGTA